jgi:hypothetical protein
MLNCILILSAYQGLERMQREKKKKKKNKQTTAGFNVNVYLLFILVNNPQTVYYDS